TITGKPPRSDVVVGLTDVPSEGSRGLGRSDQFAAAQCQPELDPIARVVQAATRQRLYAANAVAKGVAVAVQPPRGALPLSVALDKRLQRTHQFSAVVAFTRFDGAKDGVAEEPKRFVVLKRQQQLERSKILVACDRSRRTGAVVPLVTVRRQGGGLKRALCFVEAAPRLIAGDGPAHRNSSSAAKVLADPLS